MWAGRTRLWSRDHYIFLQQTPFAYPSLTWLTRGPQDEEMIEVKTQYISTNADIEPLPMSGLVQPGDQVMSIQPGYL